MRRRSKSVAQRPAEAPDFAPSCADFIGLNFSPQSSRCIGKDEAAKIIGAACTDFPETKFIGVFVDQSLDFVQQMVDDLGLDGVQLHGNETPAFVASVRAFSDQGSARATLIVA